jgi:hypothetical protein
MAKTGFRAGRNEQTTQENLELLTGQRGNGLDRAITLRDLASTDLVSVSKSASGIYTISTKSSSSAVLVPTTPTGVEVSGGFSSITVRWDIPKYTGHSHTEIWRGTMETFTDAAMIATTPASVFGDLVATGSSFYYWVRHVNTNDRAGAYNATLGTLGETSRDISELIDDITAQMLESDLIRLLNEDTAANTAAITEAQEAIESARSDIETTSQALSDALAQAKSELENAIDTLEATNDIAIANARSDIETSITDQQVMLSNAINQARLDLEGVIATLEATHDGAIASNSTRITELTSSVATDNMAMSQALSQLQASTSTLSSELSSQILSVAQSVTNTEESLSSLITSLNAKYQDADSAIIGEIQTLYSTLTTELISLTSQFTQAVSEYQTADSFLSASMTSLTQTVADNQESTAQQILTLDTKYETETLALSSSISSLEQTVANSESATSTKLDLLESKVDSENTELSSSLSNLSQTVADNQASTASLISDLDSKIDTETSSLSSSLSDLQQVVTSSETTTATRISELESKTDLADLSLSALVTELSETVATNQEAMAMLQQAIDSGLEYDDTAIYSSLSNLSQTITNTEQSLSTLITVLESNYQDADSAIISELQTLYTTVTTELNSLTKQFTQAVSQYEAADATLSASISELSQTLADSETATSSQLIALDSKIDNADSTLSSSISNLSQTLTNSQSSTATQITELISRIETFESDLSANITSVSETLTSANGIIAQTIGQLTATYNALFDSQSAENSARLTEIREAVATIDEQGSISYRAMWAMKAEAGDITAGIGILAKSDGTSQVAVSASQFFIFDPNTANSLTPLFAVSNGAVTIPKAFIEEATIQVLNAQTITADYVKSGISIETPTLTSAVINGAEIHIGTGFNVTQDGYMTATSGKFAGRIEASDGFFNGNISSATMNGGSITGALITGSVIMGSQIYTGDELYLCFGDNVNTNQTYTFNSGIYVSAKKTIAITTQVNVQTNGQTPDNCLEFYAAGDKSMGFVSQERARYRTIPADVFDIRFDRSSLSGSGFMEFHLQMVGQSNNVIADVKITSPDSMPSIGTEFNVGGVVFYVYDNNLLASSASFVGSPYHVKSFGIRNRRSDYGPGWTSSVSAVGRFRAKIYSTNDGGGTVTYKATINNSVDPR